MKLIIAIIRDEDNNRVSNKLIDDGFRVTQIASTGGFLRSGRSTLLIGVTEDQLEAALQVLRTECTPAKNEEEKKATVFVLDVQDFVQL
jgi:uncharacterized protein YaaQ